MAPKDAFTKDQQNWINATFPDYMKKSGKCKLHKPGWSEPTNDKDLSNWVTARKDKFLVKFKDELEASDITIPDWIRVSINRYFPEWFL
jgi:hypothetical protein